MPSHTKRRISVTINPNLENMMQKTLEKTGMSRSALVEEALGIYLKQKLTQDVKQLAKMQFTDLPSEEEWLEIQNI